MDDLCLAMIGFGEAAQAFAEGMGAQVVAFDAKVRIDGQRERKLAEIRAAGADVAEANPAATAGSTMILSLVTADAVLDAAAETATGIEAGALFCDMNSVAPDTKRAAARIIEAAGGRYVDVAVMSPVLPARRDVPFVLAGPHAAAARSVLEAAGFANVGMVEGGVGAASSIKIIRSVMVKGIEALSAECAVAAHAAGVLDEVVASLDASWPGADWRRRFDYNLDRMVVHGGRRAAEMEESATTLEALAIAPLMTRGKIERQRALGRLHVAPPSGLDAKLAILAPSTTSLDKADAS